MDTRFTQNIEVVTEICEHILKSQMDDIAWDCVGYENLATLSEDSLLLMKNAGCKIINIGIESGNDTIRERINKRGTTKEIFHRVQMIKRLGIGVRAYFMIGFPGETNREIEDTVNYAFSLPADIVQFEIVCPHPGTELLKYLLERYNLNRIDWNNFNVYNSPYPLSEIDSEELYKMLKKIRRQYFLMMLKRRFQPLWKQKLS